VVPHFHNPSKETVNVLIVYKDFLADKSKRTSHVGLGNNALMTQKVLRKHGVRCDTLGSATVPELKDDLKRVWKDYTHVFVQGLWVPTDEVAFLCHTYADTHWYVRNHSQVSFLQYDTNGFRLIREQMRLQDQVPNLTVTANNPRFCAPFESVYQNRCLYLPNLYDPARPYGTGRHPHTDRVVKIASFGALRPQKNHASAAFAALLVGQKLNRHVEFWMNCGREGGEDYYLRTVRQMYEKCPYAELKLLPWCGWDEFRLHVSTMDVLLAPTYSETFCIVAADACAERVPIVASSAVEWLPEQWKADTDDVHDIAERAISLLNNPNAGDLGYQALVNHQKEAVKIWIDHLSSSPLC
jgi:hypothetical protein